ncbi:MAG: hypothetical protein WCQ66_06625 [Sphaerochaetaceae bacterium]
MKKSAIVSVVFAGVMIVIGFALMIGSLGAYQFHPMMGGYMMDYQGAFVGYQMLRMIFASALFVGGIVLLCLSGFLFVKSASCGKAHETIEGRKQDATKTVGKEAETVQSETQAPKA